MIPGLGALFGGAVSGDPATASSPVDSNLAGTAGVHLVANKGLDTKQIVTLAAVGFGLIGVGAAVYKILK